MIMRDKVGDKIRHLVSRFGNIDLVAEHLVREVWALEELIRESEEKRIDLESKINLVKIAVNKY